MDGAPALTSIVAIAAVLAATGTGCRAYAFRPAGRARRGARAEFRDGQHRARHRGRDRGRSRLGVRDYAARGFAVGLSSHGVGMSRAFRVDDAAGAFAGLAMALDAILAALLAPALLAALLK